MSKLSYKGNWSPDVDYEIGDVVVYTDGIVYFLQQPTLKGSTPHDTRCWFRLQATLAACVLMFHEFLSSVGGVIFDSKTLILDSSTEDSTKRYAITVDDEDGLAATEIEEDGES